MPWTARTFRKHNQAATPEQLKIGARVANETLKRTGDDGIAVRTGNHAIRMARIGKWKR